MTRLDTEAGSRPAVSRAVDVADPTTGPFSWTAAGPSSAHERDLDEQSTAAFIALMPAPEPLAPFTPSPRSAMNSATSPFATAEVPTLELRVHRPRADATIALATLARPVREGAAPLRAYVLRCRGLTRLTFAPDDFGAEVEAHALVFARFGRYAGFADVRYGVARASERDIAAWSAAWCAAFTGR
jgi:hypothetical protein